MIAAAADAGPLAWTVSRAAGVAALLLASASVCVGISQGAGWIRGQASRDLRPLHEALSIATLVAIAVHGLALLGDTYIGFSVADIAIPFASGYQPLWTGLGIIAGWALAALGLSFYARGALGPKRWRLMHRTTALFWIAAVIHSLLEGTDAGKPWFLATALALILPAAALLLTRWSARADSPAPPPRAAALARPAALGTRGRPVPR